MQVRILGSAAGGGLPQWNCACANCEAARAGSADVVPRSQSSVALSSDGRTWFLLGVSPDVRHQILCFPELGPPRGVLRGTALGGCVLTDAEIDHTAGLLLLREGGRLAVYSTALVRRWLEWFFPVGPIVSHFAPRQWRDLPLDESGARRVELQTGAGEPTGLRVRALPLDPHVPRYVEDAPADATGSVIALEVEDVETGGRLLYAPCVGSIGEALRSAGQRADAVLLDGTFWDDDEPRRHGVGERTARQMGHLPVAGAEGTLRWLARLPARHRLYVHINNTNPMLRRSSPQRQEVEAAGVRVAQDGDALDL